MYISCKPTSLARDLPVILAAGYEVVKGCSVDMFPGTSGVETVVMLSRKKTDSVINVKAVEELKHPRKHPTAEKVEATKDALLK